MSSGPTAADDSVSPLSDAKVPSISAAVSQIWPPALAACALVALWQLAVTAFSIPRYLLPPPSLIVQFLVSNLPLLLRHAQTTAWEILIGFAGSVALGFPLGVVLVASPLFARTVYPLIVVSQTFPKLAVAPLFVVWFGFGPLPKFLVAFLIAFFPILIDTAVGLHAVNEDTITLARSIGLGRAQTFLKIRLPQALPSIMGGLKIGVTLAVIGAVVGEFLGSDTGLGYLIVQASGNLNTPLLFSALVVLTLEGLLFYLLVSLAERLSIPWYVEKQEQAAIGSM